MVEKRLANETMIQNEDGISGGFLRPGILYPIILDGLSEWMNEWIKFLFILGKIT